LPNVLLAHLGTNGWGTANVEGTGDGVGTCHGMSIQDDTGNPAASGIFQKN